VQPGALPALKMKPVIVDAAYIQSQVKPPKYDLIDARTGAYYDGVMAGRGLDGPASGHLPGAKNIPFNTVVDASGKLKPAAELTAMFRAAGVEPGDRIVVYCHIGYQATAVIYAARTIGIDAKLYDGSFQDWAGRGLPLELAARGG
jgi:thiosulfate/3-mercaptopyruvate sulfurtransferase